MPCFDHAAVESLDIGADVAFYVDVLGGTLLRWGSHVKTGLRVAMISVNPGVKIELMEVRELTGELVHTAFRAEDGGELERLVSASGCPVVAGPFRIDGARADACSLVAPGGSVIQLISYDADSPDLVQHDGS